MRETFGKLLGKGDYGHLVIEHASMLMRTFGSMREFSNQGFESSHKADRRLYQQATNHDISQQDSSGMLQPLLASSKINIIRLPEKCHLATIE